MNVEKPKSDCPPLRGWIMFAALGTIFVVGLVTCAQFIYGWLAKLWG